MTLNQTEQVLIRLQLRVSPCCDSCSNIFKRHFPSLPAPFATGGHPDEQYYQAAHWSLRWDHSLWMFRQKAAEILIAFKAGLKDFFISYLFGFGFA